MPKGHHFVEVPLNEVILFIRQGKCIPLVDAAECVDEIDMDSLQLIGYANSTYQYMTMTVIRGHMIWKSQRLVEEGRK